MISNPTFTKETTGIEVAKALSDNIRGKIVLITGMNPRGIGAHTAYAIASEKPALLILTYRSKDKLEKVLQQLSSSYPAVEVKTVFLDVEFPDSIRKAAKDVNMFALKIDVLINNAGVMAVQKRTLTQEGIEAQFATNYLGTFLFTNLLLEKLRTASKSSPAGSTRIINVAAGLHALSPINRIFV